MRVQQLSALLAARFEGDGDLEIERVAPLETAGAKEIAFVSSLKFADAARKGKAACLIVPPGYAIPGRTCILAADPRAAIAQAIRWLHPRIVTAGIHETAIISPTARVDSSASIGPYCVIGDRCRVGEECVLHSNVTLYSDVQLGDRVTLHAGVVLGADGFGYVWKEDHYENFPQIGRVILGNDIELGAQTCVDRAALGVTEIGDGTKIDNMVHIGHNCKIGRHVVIAAQTGLAGGVEIGDRAIIGGQVGFGDKARVEPGAIIGSGAGILTGKIVRAGEPVWGTPARPLRQYLKQLATLARLAAKR
ncbi:MAG TPA: UDP-3-O-(3-hydroxymyristoyl)glucosamine N-acyltransferase [Bryobacteraceae bacterium]